MVVVLADDVIDKTSLNAIENREIIEAAQMYGCRVYTIPSDFSVCETAENALAYVPIFDEPVLGVWSGFIPTYERYQAIYNTALTKNIRLINTPRQHQIVMEFSKFYPLITHLTPKSVVIDNLSQLPSATQELEFPVFVKGGVKSNKEQGLSSVVANDMTELEALVSQYFKRDNRTRGHVIVREFVSLVKIDEDPNGFPISREYRAFVRNGKVVEYGFYWDEYEDKDIAISMVDAAIRELVSEVAKVVDVPFISVDIAQLASGEWTVIELGDGQFSGLSTIPVLHLWSKISQWQL